MNVKQLKIDIAEVGLALDGAPSQRCTAVEMLDASERITTPLDTIEKWV